MLSEAQRFACRDDWSQGRRWFEDYVTAHPQDAEAHAWLAFFVVKESRYDTARGLQLIERALQLDPVCWRAYLHRAMILGNLMQADGAADALQEAQRGGAPPADLVRMRAWIDLDLWRVDEAVAGFSELVQRWPSSSAMVLLATAHLQAGQNEKALHWARQAQQTDGDDFRGWAYGGVALLYLQRHAEAATELQEALRRRPDSTLALHTLALVELGQGRVGEAEAYVRRVLEVDPRYVTSRKLLGDLCARSGRADEARQHYRDALQAFPDYAEARACLNALQ